MVFPQLSGKVENEQYKIIIINTKFAHFAGLYISVFYNISQPNFAAISVTNFSMLFVAVVTDFVLLT